MRKIFKTISAAVVCMLLLMCGVHVYASDNEILSGTDPDDAVKGHIYVRAIVEEGNETDITVELFPLTSEGVMHRYELTSENGYGVSDDVRVGGYEYIAYTSVDGTKAEHPFESIAVTEEEPSVFTVIAGSPDFAEQYTWLCSYTTDDGNSITGVISKEDAKRYFEKSVSAQTGEYSGTEEENYDELSGGDTEAFVEPEIPTPIEDPHEEDGVRIPMAVLLIPVLIIAAAAAAFRKKGRR